MADQNETLERSRTARKWELFNEWIPFNLSVGPIGPLSSGDRQLLRRLATRVAEIAEHPEQSARGSMWIRFNRLDPARPMVLVFPEGAWQEILPRDSMKISDPFWGDYEWRLRQLIYRAENIPDDHVVERVMPVPLVYSNSGWGLEIKRERSSDPRGSYKFAPPIVAPEDVEMLRFPEIQVDEELTRANFQAVNEAFGDILDVRINRRARVDTSLVGTLGGLRGLEQLMMDMVDQPEWVHRAMGFLMEGTIRQLDFVEAHNLIDNNNSNDYVGSGGLGYSDQIGAPTGEVRLRDTWGFAEAQEFSMVSPAMHEEFALRYQIPLLERFGLNCYGCCEPLTRKFDIIKKVPRLRRVSISPWADLGTSAKALEDKYILSWKPNPTSVIVDFDPDRVRDEIRNGLEITRGCVVEVIMKDTHTIEGHPERLGQWARIAKELAESRA